MNKLLAEIRGFDRWFINFLNRSSLTILRMSLALIFIWFGALKPFGQSPAVDLIKKTVYWLDPDVFIPILGVWEMAIGVCLLIVPLIRVGLFLLALQMPGTFLPLVLLPEICFTNFPFDLTLEGQYIIKNLVLIGAGLVVGSRLIPLEKLDASKSPAPQSL
ncbi:hypothetical protein LBMAG10_11770 [Actinomycetes bacterium]|nr:hypothetical protein LBMAG10_11770 [Actinomycetes bacterium]